MKHILVATDFSETATAALNRAVEIAQLSGARITLLHVIYADKINETLLGLDAMEHLTHALDEPGRLPETAMDRLRAAAQDKLRDAANGVSGPRPTIETVIAEGRPSVEIAAFADAHDVDLIVLGTNGRGRVGKAFLGSVADNVIRQADVPVMVVRE
jgi:nucleotide-binding universal stress UspA family protein